MCDYVFFLLLKPDKMHATNKALLSMGPAEKEACGHFLVIFINHIINKTLSKSLRSPGDNQSNQVIKCKLYRCQFPFNHRGNREEDKEKEIKSNRCVLQL